MNYYQRLKDLREDHDIKQADIAKIINTTQQQICKYETGKQMMGIDKYIKLAEFYNVSIDYLAGVIETPKPLHEKFNPNPTSITTKEQKILKAYKDHPEMQEAIDKLLDI